eukprot:TRINITY_DN984_c0_g1_i1.p1 TRINITY_DN984_c0_g1~~TRINITY_DN984_c0_g1_i1.p1  ORF type:complete len:159 (-),score=23.80 TRINITY_DN984_c0_g1_i1:107-583(-)
MLCRGAVTFFRCTTPTTGTAQGKALKKRVLLTTRDEFYQNRITGELGIVFGTSTRARSFFHDLWCRVLGFFGGEIEIYGSLISATTQSATQSLLDEAEKRGADGVVRYKIENDVTSDPTAGVFSWAVAYGTAVQLEIKSQPNPETAGNLEASNPTKGS